MISLRKIKKTFADMDKVLFFVSLILIIFGTLNIVTASSREAVVNNGANLFYYFFKHSVILVGSLIGFLILLKIPTKQYRKLMPIIYIVILGLNMFLILRGVTTRGANNWIDLKFIKVQPSEFAKPVLIITLALLFETNYRTLINVKEKHDIVIWKILGFGLIFPILVFLQKDLGTAIILLGIFIVMFLSSPISSKEKLKSAIILGVIGVIGLLTMLNFAGYILSKAQLSRFDFYNPCSKYTENGYQICNAFIAINNGGLTGVGIGKSTQKYSYIPEPHTDMVFAIIAEENGVLICSLIFLGYIIILYRILKLSMKVRNLKNKYICLGVATYIFLHILVNLGGLFGVIPLTGVPLPFLSYGGSFTLSLIATLGIIQRIHIEYKNEKIKVK